MHRQSQSLVVQRDLHDEAQVGENHPLPGLGVPGLDALGQADFLRRRDAAVLADLAKINADVRVFALATDGGRGFSPFNVRERCWFPRQGS